ncbi:MAG: hypothetical protein ACK55Z_32330, partial [bacterium]
MRHDAVLAIACVHHEHDPRDPRDGPHRNAADRSRGAGRISSVQLRQHLHVGCVTCAGKVGDRSVACPRRALRITSRAHARWITVSHPNRT